VSHPLVRKELRSLAPFAGLILFFNLLNWADVMLTKFPDQYPLHELFSESGPDNAMMFMVAFALAAGLLVREADDGTLAFLDALPLSRARIFLTKTTLALAVLWLLPLSDFVLRVTLYSWSRTSLNPQFPWSPMVTRTFLDAASSFVYLALGLVLSFFRRFSLLVLGVLVCVYQLLHELQVPFIPLLNMFSLSEPVFQGQHWLLPITKLAVQLGGGLVCLVLAFGAFEMVGDTAQKLSERALRRRGAIWVGGLAVLLSIGVWGGLLIYWARQSDDEQQRKVKYEPWRTSRSRTLHYRFLYPENQAGLVSQLMDRADAIETRVRQFLHAQPIPWITADLTGSASHTAGVAHWKQVQIELATIRSGIDQLAAVFAHETTHVYIDHQSEDRLWKDFNANRFFHEGLATYVEYHLFRPAEQLASLRRVAATMHARHEVSFEELIDTEALTRKRDLNMVYPLGEVFVAALIKRYGEESVAKVISAFARPDAPTGLHGAELWRDVFQAWGGNLGEVEDLFFAELDQAVAEHQGFIDSVPRLRGAVQRESGQITVRVSDTERGSGAILCRFRPSADTPERLYEYASEKEANVFQASSAHFPDRSFWYQLGWLAPGASQAIYEPWIEITLR